MTEEQRKEGILKQCKGLPSVVEKYIDFLIEKINKLVKENNRLKAGRPQWHDLEKDPNDLPDEGVYLVVWQNLNNYREIMIMNYEEDDEEKLHWFDDEQDCWDNDVIAWCKIPQFKE